MTDKLRQPHTIFHIYYAVLVHGQQECSSAGGKKSDAVNSVCNVFLENNTHQQRQGMIDG
jgi:hypothetical protein